MPCPPADPEIERDCSGDQAEAGADAGPKTAGTGHHCRSPRRGHNGSACPQAPRGWEPGRRADDDVGVTSRRGADWTGGGQSHGCTVLSLLPPARHLRYSFLPVPRVDLATIAAARHRQEAARILRDEVFNRSDDGNPSLELWSGLSRSWLLATGCRR